MNNVNDANERIYSQIGINPATKATLTREGGEAIVCEVKGASTTTSRLGYKATIPAGTSFAEAGKYTLSIPEAQSAYKAKAETASTPTRPYQSSTQSQATARRLQA